MAILDKSYEADNRTKVNHEGAQPNAPLERLTATSIIGDRVENPEGEDLGKIDNLMLNLQTGAIEYVVIEFGSVLGIGGKLFAIPFRELKVNESKRVFVLNRSREYLKDSPGFDSSHWPGTNDHSYFSDVDTYYNRPEAPLPFP